MICGAPLDDPHPSVGNLPGAHVHPLVFGAPPLDFALPGMSDVMPYASSRFSQLGAAQLDAYRTAWRAHLARVIEKVRPDLIHSHHIWLLSAFVKDIAPDLPVVTHCHGTGLRQLDLCPHLAGEVLDGCRRNDRFLALHGQQAEQLAAMLDVDAARITVVGAGFRQDIFNAPGRSLTTNPCLIYAGKLSHAKGLPQLLDAFELLRREIPALKLHVAGAGAGEEADALVARMKGLAPHVVWHGQLAPDELAAELRRAGVFVLPSFYEGFALVVVEAIACGCRVVSSDLFGTRLIAARAAGAIELVALPEMESIDRPASAALPAFVERLAAGIRQALARPPLARPGELVRDFTWSAACRRIEGVWRRSTN